MKQKFEMIESVQGLRKIVALESKSMDLAYASASVNSGLAVMLLKQFMAQRQSFPESVNQVIVNFSNSKMLLYSLKDYVLALHVDDSFNVQEMRKVLKSSQETGQQDVRQAKDEEVLQSLEKVRLSGDHLLIYKHIMESLKEHAQDKLGAFVAANKLRESKERLHSAYKLLQAFVVGKDGSVVFKNTPEESVASGSRAIAAWTLAFFRKCQEIIPEFPSDIVLELVKAHEKKWKPLGFAEAWREEKLVSDLDA